MTIINTVAGSSAKLAQKEVIPTSFPTVVEPPEGYDGLSKATVDAPVDLLPENIGTGKTIAGVAGGYTSPVAEFSFSVDARPDGWDISDYRPDFPEEVGWNKVKIQGINGLPTPFNGPLGATEVTVRQGTVIGSYEDWEANESYGWVNDYSDLVAIYGGEYSEWVQPVLTGDSMPELGTVRNPIYFTRTYGDIVQKTLSNDYTYDRTVYRTMPGDMRRDNQCIMRSVQGMRTPTGEKVATYLSIGAEPTALYVYSSTAPEIQSYTYNYPKNNVAYVPRNAPYQDQYTLCTSWSKALYQMLKPVGDKRYACGVKFYLQDFVTCPQLSSAFPMPQSDRSFVKYGYDNGTREWSYNNSDGKNVSLTVKNYGYETSMQYLFSGITNLNYYSATGEWKLALSMAAPSMDLNLLKVMYPPDGSIIPETGVTPTSVFRRLDVVGMSVIG